MWGVQTKDGGLSGLVAIKVVRSGWIWIYFEGRTKRIY